MTGFAGRSARCGEPAEARPRRRADPTIRELTLSDVDVETEGQRPEADEPPSEGELA
jgi:hypothetical protein